MDAIEKAVTDRLPEGETGTLARALWNQIAEARRQGGEEAVAALLEKLATEHRPASDEATD